MRRAPIHRYARSTLVGLALACAPLACELAYPLDGYTGTASKDGSLPDRQTPPPDGAHRDRVPPDGASADVATDAADATVGDAADATTDADAAADGGGCGRFFRGPKMVLAGAICIDTTEVTEAQYKTFLVAKGADTTGQAPECTWNVDWSPDTSKCPFDPVGMADFPVNGMDFCDAVGFCVWAGKRLCGRVGGGVVPSTDAGVLDDSGVSERTAVCSHGGLHQFPYGDTFNPESCNGGEHSGTRVTVPVGTTPGCQGGYPGVFDMAGNVHEWENACDSVTAGAGGATDICAFRGGSYHDVVEDSCFTEYAWPRSMIDCDIGIRCCADP